MHTLTVAAAENGMKLLTFLARRLENGESAGGLHRWIRTGQVRVNGRRAGAFDRLAEGDAVRLPPFAALRALRDQTAVAPGDILEGVLPVLAATEDYLALDKPANLTAQPGSKHDDSVAGILRRCFAASAYIPAPAHRLDKMTSGILLAGRTHRAQEALHALFARRDGAELEKVYLAWVGGKWPHAGETVLQDRLAKQTVERDGRTGETMVPVSGQGGKPALSRASLVARRETPFGPASLLRVTLETGRTNQIRAQLSIRHLPIIGDVKYGGKRFSRMLLHAHSLVFPWNGETVRLVSFPDWPAPFTVAQASMVAYNALACSP